MFDDQDHVTAALEALHSSNGMLNPWEVDFLSSMLHVKFPSPKQLTTLEILAVKAKMKMPRARRPRGRYRRGGGR